MVKTVFLLSFILSVLLHGVFLYKVSMADVGLWANQAEYVRYSDSRQFDFLGAYGHPGGPIIEGTLLFHEVLGISYEAALLLFMSIFNGLIIAISCVLCFVLSKKHLWWVLVLLTLSINAMYEYATPPSTLATLLTVLLCLFTLFLLKRETLKTGHLVLWGLISGFLMSTRLDIGSVMSLVLFLSLYKKIIDWKCVLWLGISALVSFLILDPFMWFMPITHLGDLLYKMLYHYNDFGEVKMSTFYVVAFSCLAFTGMLLTFFQILLKNEFIPRHFVSILALITVILYSIFLTADYQASRYFMPIVLIWQTFLPICFLYLLEGYHGRGKKIIKISMVGVIGIYPIGLMIHSVLLNNQLI